MLIGIDIGGTKCAVICGNITDGTVEISYREQIATAGLTPFEVFDTLSEKIEALSVKPDAVGISCGGPLDSKRGVILSPPNLPGWDSIEAVKYFEDRFGCPVGLQNDANACALAEYKFGAGRGCDNMVFLTFGTGMGAGLILDGKLYSGTNDMAGEVGHIRLDSFGPSGFGKPGSFEGYCSGGGIAKLGIMKAWQYIQLGKKPAFFDGNNIGAVSAKAIAEAAYNGDECAIEVYDICAEKLGSALSIIIDFINPQKIVIGSIFERSESLLREKMTKVIQREALELSYNVCEIVGAELGDKIGDYASLAIALNSYEMQGGFKQ